jgi:hypothetical protein
MFEQTQTPAAPSAATAVVESTPTFDVPRSGTPEYAEWRKTGNLQGKQDQPNTEASAASDTSERTTADDAADSAATQTQEQKEQQRREKRRPDVEQRFEEMSRKHRDEVAQLRRELEEARKPKQTQAESSPARPAEQPQQPQSYEQWRKSFKASGWMEGYLKENPEATYEDAQFAMSEHVSDVRKGFETREQQLREQRQALDTQMAEARTRYPDFDAVARPFADELYNAAPVAVLAIVDNSPVMNDLLYTIAGDANTKADFLTACRTNPAKALRAVLTIERDIQAALGTGGTTTNTPAAVRNDKGQFTKTEESPAPAKRGPESAPPPPIEVGNRGNTPLDESERAFKDAESGDINAFRRWKQAEDAKDLRRRRGV